MSGEGFVVRCRGLPWSVTAEELIEFLKGSNTTISKGMEGVHMLYTKDGTRPNGEAYVELDSQEDVETALTKHNMHMGKRYVEVFSSDYSEMEYVLKKNRPADTSKDAVLRLRGLPYGCSKEEVAQFFTGYEIVPYGITIQQDFEGRSTGDAYVQFTSQDIADKASLKHKEKIGHRYIEIFKSSLAESQGAASPGGRQMGGRPRPYDRNDRFGGGGGGMGGPGNRFGGRNVKGYGYDDDFYGGGGGGGGNNYGGGFGGGSGGGNFGMSRGGRGGGGGGGRFGGGMGGGGGGGGSGMGARGGGMGERNTPGANFQSKTGHSVHMRGLPFQATLQDIIKFFSPVECVDIQIHYYPNQKSTGEADVDFVSHDEACKAMKKDKSNMDHRYIELFLNSSPSGSRSRGGSGGPPSLMNSGMGYGQGYNSGNNYDSGFGGNNYMSF